MTTSTTSRLKDQRAHDYQKVVNYLNRTKDRKNIPANAKLNIILIVIVTVITIVVVAIAN